MTRKRRADPIKDRKQQPSGKDRSNDADRGEGTRRGRSGEGSASALATLESIERDRKRSWPGDLE